MWTCFVWGHRRDVRERTALAMSLSGGGQQDAGGREQESGTRSGIRKDAARLRLASGLQESSCHSLRHFQEDCVRNFVQDLRFALRQMRRSPGFVFTAVLTLALGGGADTAVYSLLDQALLRSLPGGKPEQLVVL